MTFSKWVTVSVICEGATEVFFVKTVLNPYFKSFRMSLKPIDAGGAISVDKLLSYINKANGEIVTTLVDFYGFINPKKRSAQQLIEELQTRSKKERLLPYIQLYELEALWFSDINVLASQLQATDVQQQALQTLMTTVNHPEEINNRPETAPSKRLEKLFIGYNKVLDGQRIANRLGVPAMLAVCPGFRTWVDTLVCLADTLR